MNKILKNMLNVIIFTILFFMSMHSFSFAVSSVDMNLAANSQDNALANNSVSTNSTSNTTLSNTSAGTVSNLSPLPDSDLGLSNILNIILIAVGVVLILLGLAIIIKLKK